MKVNNGKNGVRRRARKTISRKKRKKRGWKGRKEKSKAGEREGMKIGERDKGIEYGKEKRCDKVKIKENRD